MDTSETYIKMCDCEEIQGKHELESGDFFYQRLEKAQPSGYIQGVHIEENCNDYGSLVEPNNAKLVWLPRQDELQAMIEVEESPYTLVEKFWAWFDTHNNSPEGIDYESMEQLWLAFYMHVTHSKTWTDSNVWNSR